MSQLTPEQFYKWRLAFEEMQHAETRAKGTVYQLEIFNRDLEILRLKTQMFKNHVQSSHDAANLAKEKFQNERAALEGVLGFSLSNCTIDEVTFEVKTLEG